MEFPRSIFAKMLREPVQLIGEVFGLKAIAMFFDKPGGKYRKRMHVHTKSDITIIPLTFAERLSLELEVKAIVNSSEGYLSRVRIKIGEKEFVTTVFCEREGKYYILGVKTLQEFSRIEIDFRNKLLRFHY